MFILEEFLRQLDAIYSKEPSKAGGFLSKGLLDATKEGKKEDCLAVLNELMGFHRVMNNYDACEACIDRSMNLCEEMNIKDSIPYATVLLNMATAYRAMGKHKEAENCYMEAQGIMENEITEPDYRVASLYNNLGLLYQETGRLPLAKDFLNKALVILNQLSDTKVEIATTFTNLGNVSLSLHEIENGKEYMHKAIDVFKSIPGKKDSHYSSALSGLGQVFYLNGELEKAWDCYKEALVEIQSNYGENQYYRIVFSNLNKVEDLIRRREAFNKYPGKGLEMAKKFYDVCGKPMIEKEFPKYIDRMAIGLCGEGSECMGFDDQYSTDHDYGPGFCIWLTKNDFDAIGNSLSDAYNNLSSKFEEFPPRNYTSKGNSRVGVFCIDDFFEKYTGHAFAPKENSKWHKINQQGLLAVTNGTVFYDPLGEFTRRRASFSQYPIVVRMEKLCLALGNMAQSGQYNLRRILQRDDKPAAFLAFSAFIESAIEAGYILNNQYMPFYKWLFKGMENFVVLKDLKRELEALIDMGPCHEDTLNQIENICKYVVKELNSQGLPCSEEPFLDIQKEYVLQWITKNV